MTTRTLRTSDTERSFEQRRIALLGLVLALLGVFGLALSLIEEPSRPIHDLYYVGSAVQLSLWTALWLSCRGRPRSPTFLRTAEGICLVGTGIMFGMMFRLLDSIDLVPGADPLLWGPEPAGYFLGTARLYWALAHLFGLTLYCILRAALVPSRPMRTLVLTLLAGVPLAVFATLPSVPWDSAQAAQAAIPPAFSALGALNVAMQWAFTVALCTVTSHIIYGLRTELQQARRLGQYTLRAKIGEGGMGTVYRASHAMLRRPTAIKLLSHTSASAEQVARFEREVQQTARLTHANTITIFDYGRTPEGIFYYAMELLDGASAQAVVDVTGPMSAARVIHVLQGVCNSLEEAHGVGLIHRDIKPANIFLCVQGGRPDVPKLLDFGLVKEIGADTDAGLTVAGTVAGTPLYMAPESITRPDAVDGRADLYAVGAVGYFLLTGKHVFEGATVMEICSHHLRSEPQPPSTRLGAPIPEDLEALVLECLRKNPQDRPQSAAALSHRLGRCVGPRPWTALDAREWWDEYGHIFAAQQEAAEGSVSAKTIAREMGRADATGSG